MNRIGNASSFTTEKLSVFDDARFTGTLKLQNASGTSNALEFPSGHMISEGASSGDWYFYGNRDNGKYPFVVRSHVNCNNFRNEFVIELNGTINNQTSRLNVSENNVHVRIDVSN